MHIRDSCADPHTLNAGYLHVQLTDASAVFSFYHQNMLTLDREAVIELVAGLQAWLDTQGSIPERKPILISDTRVTCPYCGRRWDKPQGSKAGFVMAAIYRHVLECRYQNLTVEVDDETNVPREG